MSLLAVALAGEQPLKVMAMLVVVLNGVLLATLAFLQTAVGFMVVLPMLDNLAWLFLALAFALTSNIETYFLRNFRIVCL
jgi:UPF0716 family protein affecting phage T7 exclusion